MYQGLGFDLPLFAHIPLILAQEGGRMSKRFGATAITEYRNQGYLSKALVNYLLLLGWSAGNNQEIISLDQAKNIFDIKHVNKTAAAFSYDKLNWLNAHYIKQAEISQIKEFVLGALKQKNIIVNIDDDYLNKVSALFQDRITKLMDIVDWGDFCFNDKVVYEDSARKVLDKKLPNEMEMLKNNLKNIDNFDKNIVEQVFRNTAEELNIKAKELVHPTRVALTGRSIGPGLFETMEVLGKEKVIDRINRLIAFWKEGE